MKSLKPIILVLVMLFVSGMAAAQAEDLTLVDVQYEEGEVSVVDVVEVETYMPQVSEQGDYTLELLDAENESLETRDFDIQTEEVIETHEGTEVEELSYVIETVYFDIEYAEVGKAVLYEEGDEVDTFEVKETGDQGSSVQDLGGQEGIFTGLLDFIRSYL